MGTFKWQAGIVWALILVSGAWLWPHVRPVPLPPAPAVLVPPVVPAVPKSEVVEDTIQKNTTLVATLLDYNVPVEIAHEVANLIKPVFDVHQLRFGNPFRLEKELNGSLRAFEYKIDDERVLKVHKDAETYAAHVEKLDFEVRENVVTAEIQSSLWDALSSYPRNDVLVNSVAAIFAWDIDFNTDIQAGDQIRMIVEEQYHDGAFVKYGKVQAAELANGKHTYRAFLFNDEYYDENGNAVKRAMLASPLQFNPRITSGFSRARLHPILGDVRAHLAVDYAAPTGAPVVAVANGTILSAGWVNGYGNLIQIKHANGLTTGYAHLSKISPGIRTGASVKQGTVIGNVGMTGLATGPHLHYMMTRNGTVINPLSMKSEPAVPIAAALKGDFMQSIASRQLQLQSAIAQK